MKRKKYQVPEAEKDQEAREEVIKAWKEADKFVADWVEEAEGEAEHDELDKEGSAKKPSQRAFGWRA